MNHAIAHALLQTGSVHLNTKEYFTWTSGIKSPIYCDNRKLISHPQYRDLVVNEFIKILNDFQFDCLAGTATAGIPWASFIADRLKIPMIYIRSSDKGHGLKNSIEGVLKEKSKVIVIEDLISTGKSSIAAADKVIEAQAQVLGLISIFQYGFPLKKTTYPIKSLCTLDDLLQTALELSLINNSQIAEINQWKKSINML
jgi:orotate phosphoribosyltransferase